MLFIFQIADASHNNAPERLAVYEFTKELIVYDNRKLKQVNALTQLSRLAVEELVKFLPLIPKSEHEKKAKKILEILVREADREKSVTDIPRFLQSCDAAQRNKLLNGAFLYQLWGECATNKMKTEYLIPVE